MDTITAVVKRPKFLSHAFMLLMLIVMGWLHLATPLLVALFSYLALCQLQTVCGRRKWLAVTLFLVLFTAVVVAAGYFVHRTVRVFPVVAEKAIPSIIGWAEKQGIGLSFTDYGSLRAEAIQTVQEQTNLWVKVGAVARWAVSQLVFVVLGCVVAISLFINAQFELDRASHRVQNNLYSLLGDQLGDRFAGLYRSFAIVMGAQIIISVINTTLTTIFALAVGMPHPIVIAGVTLFCGLLPVVGNLISNTIIVCIGFTVSPSLALAALVFLIAIHKLEYFLNSKIIGDRIRSPVWMTLIGLVLGEQLMGIPGMILAPVVLHYLKEEAAKVEVADEPGAPPAGVPESAPGKA